MPFLKAIILLLIIYSVQSQTREDLVIKECERKIDLRTQLIKVLYTLTLYNNGQNTINNFKWISNEYGRLVYMNVKDSNKSDLGIIKFNKTTNIITLSKTLEPFKFESFIITEVYGKGIKPFPKEILQNEEQFVIYKNNMYLDTIYFVKSQISVLILPNNVVEQYTDDPMVTLNQNNTISYGPYKNIQPLTYKKLKIHFKSNNKFLTVTELKRKIMISHWGSITVEEYIKLENTGAKLKGGFSRFDYVYKKQNALNAIKLIKTNLPASASNIYYRDKIGNISTSTILDLKDHIELMLKLRFALFGGWKINYNLGYSVPIYEYLFYDKNEQSFILNMRIIDHIFDDMFVEHVETSIILPVHAQVVSFKIPYEFKQFSNKTHYNFLDWKPQRIITLVKNDLIEEYIEDFQIVYKWPLLAYLYQPLLISGFIYCLFVTYIVYGRLDFSIVNNKMKNNLK